MQTAQDRASREQLEITADPSAVVMNGYLTRAIKVQKRIEERYLETFSLAARATESMKPNLEAISAAVASINSDILRAADFERSLYQGLAQQLREMAEFKLPPGLLDAVSHLAAQHAKWIEELAPTVRDFRTILLPENLRGIDKLNVKELESIVTLDGITMYGVPREPIAAEILRAPSSAQRHRILGRESRAVGEDCVDLLCTTESGNESDLVSFAREAAELLKRGSHEAALALAASTLDTLLRFQFAREKRLLMDSMHAKSSRARNELRFEKYLTLAPVWQAYQRFDPAGGDKIPDRFNRHACAHAVSVRQYTKSDAAQAVMLVSSLLRLLDES